MICPMCHEEPCPGPPICGLKYIARSPDREHGGFHENAIATAKQALRLIAYYEETLAYLGNALNPKDPPYLELISKLIWDALEWRQQAFPKITEEDLTV